MRLLRYLVVGTVAFAIDLGLLLLLAGHMPLLAANTLAFIAANAVNFLLGHVWVFGQALDASAAPQYARVLVASLVGLGLNDAVVWGGATLLGLPLIAAKVIATAVALGWNFLARDRWIYRRAA
jgi:putative flippase GtrA